MLAVLVPAVKIAAQTNLFTPRLALDVTTRYVDNLPMNATNKVATFEEGVSPSVGFLYGLPGRTYISMDYAAALERYPDHTAYNANNQYATLDAKALFGQGALQIKNAYQDVSGPQREISGVYRVQNNNTTATSEYQLSEKTALGLDYHQDLIDFPAADGIDYRQFVVGGSLFYHLTPKTDVFGQINQGWVEMERGANAAYQELNAGLLGKLTSKITGSVAVGYQHREFTGAVPEWNEPVAAVNVKAQLTERVAASLTASRKLAPSTAYLDATYLANEFYFTVDYRLYRALKLSVSGGCMDAKMLPTTVTDDYTRDQLLALAGLTYDLTKWMQLGAAYSYESRAYSATGNAMQNFVSLHLRLHY